MRWRPGCGPGAAGIGRIAPVVVTALFVAAFLLGGCGHEGVPPPQKPGPVVIVGAGDIADCHTKADSATARLLATIDGTVVTLGDNAYPRGTLEQFVNCYGPTWGRYKDRTRPAVGNHEYETPNAKGYFEYFRDAAGDPHKGYYSYELGSWHVLALNSMCEEVGGCGANSPQIRWLRQDLADDDKKCTLAYFHHPLFTSGRYSPGLPKVKAMWEALYEAGADVVLSGHDHNYQRFAPQDPEGKADSRRGIREFVVGTGGKSHYAIASALANTQVHDDETFGVLELTLRPGGYEWRFVPVAGQEFTDSGSASCH